MTFIRRIENLARSWPWLPWALAGAFGVACGGGASSRPPGATTVTIPDFLEFVVFDLETVAPEAVAVQSPGMPAPRPMTTLANSRLRTSRFLTSLEVRRPIAGSWRFTAPGRPPSVWMRGMKSYLRGRLRESPRLEGPAAGGCSFIYEAYHVLGEPLPAAAIDLVQARAVVLAPDGSEHSWELTPTPGPQGTLSFAGGQAVRCHRAGPYWLEVELSTRDAEGRTVVLFRDEANGFTAKP